MSVPALERLEKRVLEMGYSFFFKVEGTSMHPFLQEGDEIEIKGVTPQSLKVGDVVVLDQKFGRTAHRVVQIRVSKNAKAWVFITKGDATTEVDLPVLPCNILGVVIGYKRHGRYFQIGRLSWSLLSYLNAQYRMFKYRAGRFMLRTQNLFLMRQIYFYAYGVTARLIKLIFRIFCREARVYIKAPEQIRTFIPGASDLDLWIIFDHVDRDKKAYAHAGDLCKRVESAIPLVQGPTKMSDLIELENHMRWGGCLRQSFFSGPCDPDQTYSNKLSPFALKLSMFDASFLWFKAVSSEWANMDIDMPVCFSDPVTLKVAKTLLKILNAHAVIIGGDASILEQKMGRLLTKEISPVSFKKLCNASAGADFLNAIERLFKEPCKKQDIYFLPKDALLFCVELMNSSACILLSSFKESFPDAYAHILEHKGQDNLFIDEDLYSFDPAVKSNMFFKKISFFNLPGFSGCYITPDTTDSASVGEFMSDLNLKMDLQSTVILKESTLFCLLLDLMLRPSWLKKISKTEEKQRLNELYLYNFLRLECDRNFSETGEDLSIDAYFLPSLKMLYLGIRYSIVAYERRDIEKQFLEHFGDGHTFRGLKELRGREIVRELHEHMHQELCR